MEKIIKRNSYWCYICEIKVELSELEELKCPSCQKGILEELLDDNVDKIEFTPPQRILNKPQNNQVQNPNNFILRFPNFNTPQIIQQFSNLSNNRANGIRRIITFVYNNNRK